jgi:hypothetical protein
MTVAFRAAVFIGAARTAQTGSGRDVRQAGADGAE